MSVGLGQKFHRARYIEEFFKIVSFAPLALYFWVYWPIRGWLRDIVRLTATVYLTISFFTLIFEIVLELAGLPPLLSEYLAVPQNFRIYLTIAFWAGIALVALGHIRELGHRRHESALTNAVWALLQGRNQFKEDDYLRFSLPLVLAALHEAGAERACVWLPTSDQGGMEVREGCDHPPCGPTSPKRLPMDQGIAGAVFIGGQMHYVPRVAFPFNGVKLSRFSLAFPHALVLTVKKSLGALPTIEAEGVLPRGVVLLDGWRDQSNRSFVVAPLTIDGQKPFAVLAIDFRKTDPLGKDQLKAVATIAVVIGEELHRLRVGPPPPQPALVAAA